MALEASCSVSHSYVGLLCLPEDLLRRWHIPVSHSGLASSMCAVWFSDTVSCSWKAPVWAAWPRIVLSLALGFQLYILEVPFPVLRPDSEQLEHSRSPEKKQ